MMTPDSAHRLGPRYWVRQADASTYPPANHHHSYSQRLIGPETVGNESSSP